MIAIIGTSDRPCWLAEACIIILLLLLLTRGKKSSRFSMALSSKWAAAHADPRGPGDPRPTAIDIIQDEQLLGKLAGNVIMITGCSSGLGIETARALRATGKVLGLLQLQQLPTSAVKISMTKQLLDLTCLNVPKHYTLTFSSQQEVFAVLLLQRHVL